MLVGAVLILWIVVSIGRANILVSHGCGSERV